MSALGYGAAVGQAAIDAISARLTGLEGALPLKADASAIPSPAASAPPMVSDQNTKGSSGRFALEDHTHQSNVQAQRVQVAGSSGIATWTFTTPFDVIPVVSCHAETPTGSTYVNVASVVEGSVTTTGMQITVQRVVKSITLPTLATSLLGLVISVFGFAPAGVYVNCFARKPV